MPRTSYIFKNLEIVETILSFQNKGKPLKWKYFEKDKFEKLDRDDQKFLHDLSVIIHTHKSN